MSRRSATALLCLLLASCDRAPQVVDPYANVELASPPA